MPSSIASSVVRLARCLPSIAALLVACMLASQAAEIRWRTERFTYQAQDKPLREVLRDFAASQGLVAVISPDVESVPVNARFNLTPQTTLDTLATSFGLIWYYDGRALFIYPASDMASAIVPLSDTSIVKLRAALVNLGIADRRYPIAHDSRQNTALISGPRRYVDLVMAAVRAGDRTDATSANVEVRVFPLRYAWAADLVVSQNGSEQRVPGMVSMLRDLYSQRGPSAPTSPLADSPSRRPDVAERLRGLVPPQVNSGRAALGSSPGTMTSSGSSTGPAIQPVIEEAAVPAPTRGELPQFQAGGRNAVVVRDRPDRMTVYEGLIRTLDVKPGLVEIEVRILELSSDAVDSLGIDWRARTGRVDLQFGRGNLPTLGFDTAIAPGAPQTTPLPLGAGGNGQYGNVIANPGITPPVPLSDLARGGVLTTVLGDAGRFLIARVSALAQEGKANILSSPRVLTVDAAEAVLENINTFFVRVAGNLDVGLFNVSAGTSLHVTPLIVSDGDANVPQQVKLAIRIEDGSLTGNVVDQIPVVQRSTITTQAFINEGESLLIGGYKTDVARDADVGVPGLRSIPVLGALFSFREKQKNRVERLFLLTPRIATPST